MNFSRPLRPLIVALLGAVAAVSSACAQQVAQPTVTPTGGWPLNFIAGHLQNATSNDLVFTQAAIGSANPQVNVGLLFNNGSGVFTAPAQDTIAYMQATNTVAALGDLNGDGMTDYIFAVSRTAGQADSLCAALNTGGGNFSSNTCSTLTPAGPALPNFNFMTATVLATGGPLRVILEDSANGSISVFQYAGSAFTTVSQFSLSSGGSGPFITGDFNGDGNTDILVLSTTTNVLTPYYGNGSGTFTAGTPYTLTGGIYSMLVGDIDGDGIPDLVVEGANGALSYFPGSSTGFSATPLAIPTAQDGTTGNGGHLVAIADLNGDHIPDIITSTPAGISVLLGQAPLTNHIPYTPTYTLLGLYDGGPGRTSYALADFDGDGQPDLAIDSPEGVAILLGNANGSFKTSRSYAAGQPAYSVALGQFTGSGNVDALVATGIPQVQLLNGNGQGGFAVTEPPSPSTASETNSARTQWSAAIAGDFDGDGKLDVAVTQATVSNTSGNALTIQFGNNDGTFSAPVAEAQAGSPQYGFSVSGAFNGNGMGGIANFNPEGCAAYAGGSGARSGAMPPTPLDNNISAAAYNLVATGLINTSHPGAQDIVCQDNGTLLVYQNNGNGTFTQTYTITAPGGYATADSTGAFPTTGLFPSAVLLADLDGDGFGDLIVLFHNLAANPATVNTLVNNQIYVYWGNGDGTFNTVPTIDVPSRNYYEATVATIAGTPDLIVSDGYLVGVLTLAKTPSARASGANLSGVHSFGRTFKSPEQHYLAGAGINGIATAAISGTTAIVVANGGSVLSGLAANRGTLASNAEVNTGGITVLLPAPGLSTITGTLTASPEPSQYNQNFTLTATLIPPALDVPATGMVTFSIDGTVVGTSPVTAGVATWPVVAPTYPPGPHTLTAAYSGDTNYDATTLTGSHKVALQPSQTTIAMIATPIFYGQVIAQFAPATASPLNPVFTGTTIGGTLTFYIDGLEVCTLAVTGVSTACPANVGAGYQVGPHSIYAVYSGNQSFLGSTSPTYSVTILPDNTQGTLTSSLNPAALGTPVKFTAVFTAPYATPTGTVTFLDGATIIGTGTLDATGTATLTVSNLTLGTHPITATYAATLDFNASATTVLQQQIIPPPLATAMVLASNINPSTFGQTVTFTAVVSSNLGVPTGNVAFTSDGMSLGSAVLNAQGSASIAVGTLAVGSHAIAATYAGGSDASGNTFLPGSAALTQVVNATPPPGSFTVTVTPAAISVPIGNSTSVLVTVAALNGFSQPVTLSCSGLAREATCTFDATAIPAGGGTTHLSVAASAPHDCDNNTPYFVTPSGPTTWLGMLVTCGLIVLLRRRRGVLKGILLALALCILPALSGCGNCTDLGVPPGNYTFTVTGTSTGSPTTAVSQTVQMVAHL